MRYPALVVACFILCSVLTPGFVETAFPLGSAEVTFDRDEVSQMLLDAGASESTVAGLLEPYPADYEFSAEELRLLLRLIPQEELLEEFEARKRLPEETVLPKTPTMPRRRTPLDQRTAAAPEPGAVRPFGYDVFAYSPLEYSPTIDIPAGPDYVLGPGDELQVTLWGAVERSYKVLVNREGNLLLPELGVVQASGLTIDSFETDLYRRFSGVYSGFSLDVSLTKLRTIQVFVVGDVVRPGAYTLSSVSTVFNALYYAGGPTSRGSLRRVLVYRFGELVAEVDLYEYLLSGDNSGDIRLKSGDTVFVTTIGPTATVKGAVKRPAVYELAGKETVRELIRLAGGFTAEAYTERIELMRVERDTGVTSTVVNLSGDSEPDSLVHPEDVVVADSDEIMVYPVWHVFPKQHVSIEGEVQYPGTHVLYPGMRVSDLIFKAGGLLEQAYLLRAEVSRIEQEPESSGLASAVIFVSLEDIAESPLSPENIELRDLDRVFIRKVPGWRPQHLVKVQGEVRFPGTYTLEKSEERLSHVIERAGGLTPTAFPGAGSLHRRGEGRVIVDFARALGKPGEREDLMLVDGDSVHVPVYLNTIKVEGAVGRPGSIIFRPAKTASYYIEKTGGLLEQADKGRVRIVALDGSTKKAYRAFWFDPSVRPGSRITVSFKEQRRETDWAAAIRDATTIVASLATTVFIISQID